jgi:hypothetical protein
VRRKKVLAVGLFLKAKSMCAKMMVASGVNNIKNVSAITVAVFTITFYSKLMNGPNKLKCLSLASSCSLWQCL